MRQYAIRRRKDKKIIGGAYPVAVVPETELRYMAHPGRYEIATRELTPTDWQSVGQHGPRGANPMSCAGCWDMTPQPLACPGETTDGIAAP